MTPPARDGERGQRGPNDGREPESDAGDPAPPQLPAVELPATERAVVLAPSDSRRSGAASSGGAARGTLQLASAQALAMLCGYVVAVVLGRGLGPERYGVYGFVISVLLAVELIGRLGIPQALAKRIAERDGDALDLERTGLTLSLAACLAIFALFWSAAPLLASFFELEDGTRLFRIASIDIPIYGMYFACEHVLNGHRRFGAESVGISIYGLGKALGVLSLLAIGLTVPAALIANVAASAVGLAFLVTRLPRAAFRPSLAGAGPILRLAAPTALLFLGSEVFANLDLWSLKRLAEDLARETVGHYVAAQNLAKLPSAAYFVMLAVLVPSVARATAAGDEERVRALVRGAARLLVLVLVPVCALVAVEARGLMGLVYDAEYLPGAPLLGILVFRMGLAYPLLLSACGVLVARERAGHAAALLLSLLPLSLVLYVVLVLSHGAPGAAIGALAATVAGVAVAVRLLAPVAHPLIGVATLGRVGVATLTACVVAAVWKSSGWSLAVELVACALVYALLLVLLREVTGADLALVRSRRSTSDS